MPLCAISSLPFFWAMAPVNEPFSWPNSSLSSRVSVQRSRHQFLAGAAFSQDEDRRVLRRHARHHPQELADGRTFSHHAGLSRSQPAQQRFILGLQALDRSHVLQRRRGHRSDGAQSVPMRGHIHRLFGGKPDRQQSGNFTAHVERQGDHARGWFHYHAFAADAPDQFGDRGLAELHRGCAQLIRIAAQQDGAFAARHHVGDEPHDLVRKHGPVAAGRHSQCAEQEQQGTGAQQRVLVRFGLQGRGILAVKQHRIADAHLIVRLQAMPRDAHPVDICPRAGAVVHNTKAAILEPHGAVLRRRVHFRQPDVSRWRAADMYGAAAERKALTQ